MLPTHHSSSSAPSSTPFVPGPSSSQQQHGRDASASTNGSSDQGHTFVGSSVDSRLAGGGGGNKRLSPDASEGGEGGGEYDRPRPAYLTPVDPALGSSGGESSDGDSGTATETDDEFDWDLSDTNDPSAAGGADVGETAESIARGGRHAPGTTAATTTTGKHRARRGRKLYLWLMGLSRWFRTLVVACAGAAVLIAPFVVVMAAFRDDPARTQVQVWCVFPPPPIPPSLQIYRRWVCPQDEG